MERPDKYFEIIKYFIPTYYPNVAEVECKDNTTMRGQFTLENMSELSKTHKFMFFPKEDPTNTQRLKSLYAAEEGIEIDVDDIRKVKLLNDHNNVVQFSLNL